MRRRNSPVAVALVLVLAGCGGTRAAAPPTTTAAASTPTLTSVVDLAACDVLETKIQIISRLISASVEVMTQSVHPKQLASRAAETQKNVAYAATVVAQTVVPASVVGPRGELVAGLRRYANDFGRAAAAVRKGSIGTAAQELNDQAALGKVKAATAAIDRVCRPQQ